MEKIYVLNEPQLKELAKLLLEDYRREIVAEIHGTPKEEYLGCKQVCQELGISARTFQRYRDEYRIPFIQKGRKIYVKRSDFDAFLEANWKFRRKVIHLVPYESDPPFRWKVTRRS